jgi:CHASE2 domain-containing sensor protein
LLGRRYWALAIFLAVAVWLGLALALLPRKDDDGSYASRPYGWNSGLEYKATDLLFQLRDVLRPGQRTRGLSEPITIIEIDEQAIKASGGPPKWRRDCFVWLTAVRVDSVIGLDILLSEEGGTSAEDKAYDQQLSKSMAEAGNVVIASTYATKGFPATAPLPQFSNASYAAGFVNIPLDSDGFVRDSILFSKGGGEDVQFGFPTRLAEGYLAARTAEGQTPQYLMLLSGQQVLLDKRILPLRNDGNLQLDFRARPPAFRRISAGEILFTQNAQIADDLFRDRIVLIGAANIDSPDLFPTPFYEPSTLARLFDGNLPNVPARTPGVELHATTIATILFGQSPVRPPYRWQLMALILPIVLCAPHLLHAFELTGESNRGSRCSLVVGLMDIAVLPGERLVRLYAHAVRSACAMHRRVLHVETEADRARVMTLYCVSAEPAISGSRDQIMSVSAAVTIVFTDIAASRPFRIPVRSIVVWRTITSACISLRRTGGYINGASATD